MEQEFGKANQEKTVDSEIVRITSGLYKELREFCDRNSIRFVDFIEDSLESATYRYELEELLSDGANVQTRIESERNRSFLEGFSKGVLSATLALQGKIELSENYTPPEAKNLVVPREVAGGQMKLFK